jgi:hypothetical protein
MDRNVVAYFMVGYYPGICVEGSGRSFGDFVHIRSKRLPNKSEVSYVPFLFSVPALLMLELRYAGSLCIQKLFTDPSRMETTT